MQITYQLLLLNTAFYSMQDKHSNSLEERRAARALHSWKLGHPLHYIQAFNHLADNEVGFVQ